MDGLRDLQSAFIAMDENGVYKAVQGRLAAGEPPLQIIQQCNEAMTEIGRRFEAGELFISELIMSGEIMKQVMAEITPLLGERTRVAAKGAVVIGTVKDDIHDIGKNIVVTLLSCAGYEVHDLGVDVPIERFVEARRATNARVVGLSALLSSTYPRMAEVVKALERGGLRKSTIVVIGGSPCNEEVRRFVGADHFARDAGRGVSICDQAYGT